MDAAASWPELSGAGDRFRAALAQPRAVQDRVLQSILERNVDCAYGKRYGFGSIRSAAAYRDRLRIVRYDDMSPQLERMAQGEQAVLTAEPVVAWEQTGGSSDGAKLLPYTVSGLLEFQAGLLPWLHALHATTPEAARGRAYWSISPACREPRATPNGMPIGMASDALYFGAELAERIAYSLAVPAPVGNLRDVALWRRLTLLHLVACTDLTLISVWSPTFLLELLAALRTEGREVAACLANGGVGLTAGELAGNSAPAANPRRARQLLHLLASEPVDWRALWPDLALISCWDQAQASPYAAELRRLFPGVVVQGKGLLATEGLISIPFTPAADPVLALESGYFEFLDARGEAHGAEDIEIGGEYEVLMTTSSGLYRYALGDRVRVSGRLGRTPTLTFLGRSGVQSDLCGEKLDDAFAARALATAGSRFGLLATQHDPLGYVLVLDAQELDAERAASAAASVDHALCANPQYEYARRIGQLAPVRFMLVTAPLAAWIAHGVRRSQRLGDIKLPALYPGENWPSIFQVRP